MSRRTPGVLLVNLGSPEAPTPPAVRRYLRDFLMDGRVLDAPWPIRWCIVHLAILPRRPAASAQAYRKVWTEEGSPLIVTSRKVQAALQAQFEIPLELAMRYPNASVPEALNRLAARGVNAVHLIPLFPHYAMSSYETAVEHVRRSAAKQANAPELTVEPPFYAHPDYLEALAETAREGLTGAWDHLLFSFHGIPERHLRKSDPTGGHCLASPDCCEGDHPAHATCYRHQCRQTMRLLTQRLALDPGRCSLAFQSRLGRDPWLRPYTDTELTRLAEAGVRRLRVICPAFVSDCLETLEEIGMRGRETFLAAGGEKFDLIPCLNEHPRWLDALSGMVRRFLDGAGPPPSNATAR